MPFLDWVNKNQAKDTSRHVPYHLLHQQQTYGDAADNLLIQGDNLLALKALIPFYAGQVKCIFVVSAVAVGACRARRVRHRQRGHSWNAGAAGNTRRLEG
jgi:hypothetical protein